MVQRRMKKKLEALYHTLKAKGLSQEQERLIRLEISFSDLDGDHHLCSASSTSSQKQNIYDYNDLQLFLNESPAQAMTISSAQSLDYLLEKDKQREKDGFPRKIRVGKMVKPSQSGDDKVVIVPTTVEEKLLHDKVRVSEEGEGDGDEDEAAHARHGRQRTGRRLSGAHL